MDVSKFQVEGEWLEVNIDSEKIPDPVKFKIKPLSSMDQLEYGEAARDDRAKYLLKLYDLVLDWDLTNNGNKLDCTKANKELYMKYLLPLDLKDPEEEEGPKEILADEDKDKKEDEKPGKKIKNTVGLAIFNFAKDFTNFIKN